MTVNLVTEEGYGRMKEELAALQARRPEVAARIAHARSLGDLSENAEFESACQEQGMLEAKIRQLEQRIKNSKVIPKTELPEGRVAIGSTVKLREIKSGGESLVRLLGEGEAKFDPDAEVLEVSTSSPMGEALFKAKVGETVGVRTPRGRTEYEILELL